MYFYPRTLKSSWYRADVCNSIVTCLEGTKKWTAYYYENKVERTAYLEMFNECQRIVKENGFKPDAMLKALSDLHDTLPSIPKPPFFSLARWFYRPLEAREQAIITAFTLVDSIASRFLHEQ